MARLRLQEDGTYEIIKQVLEAPVRPITVAGVFTALGIRIK